MHVQLTPGRLTTSPKIERDIPYHKLVVNHRIAPLSPEEYALALALLRQRKEWEKAKGQSLLCLSVAHLMEATGIHPR